MSILHLSIMFYNRKKLIEWTFQFFILFFYFHPNTIMSSTLGMSMIHIHGVNHHSLGVGLTLAR